SISSLVPNKINEIEEPEVRPVPSTIKLENGCFITFQAEALANRPKNFTAPFELEIPVESLEICAMDVLGLVLFGYEDKHYCNSKPVISRFRHLAQLNNINPLWIHCVNCRDLKTLYGPEVNRVTGDLDDISSSLNSNSTKEGKQQQKTKIKIKEGSLNLTTKTTTKTQSITKTLTTTPSTVQKLLITTKHLENKTLPTINSILIGTTNKLKFKTFPQTSTIPTIINSTLLQTTNNSLLQNTTNKSIEKEMNITTTKVTEKINSSVVGKEPETIKLDNEKGIAEKKAPEPLANRPAHHKAPFELKLDVESVEICAIRCYQDGCTGAIFNKTSNTCELSYEDKYFCSSAPIISRFAHLANLRTLNVLWLHCVNCRPEVNRKTGQLEEEHKRP
ncbi:hypothetical protein Mgra_00006224, partial [Meloidogyne graminicola]